MNYLVAADRFFLDKPGGAYRIAWDLAQLARDDGHSVAVLCGSEAGDPPPGPELIQGIEVVRFRLPSNAGLRRLSPLRWSSQLNAARAEARTHLSTRRWDVVHAHTVGAGLAAYEEVGRSALRIATVHSPAVMEQDINWRDGTVAGRLKLLAGMPLLKRAESRLLRQAHVIHTLSEYTRKSLVAIYGHLPPILRLPWWIQSPTKPSNRSDSRARLGWPESQFVFFTLRRLVRRMGLDTLIDAFGRINRPECTLVIAGDGPERSPLVAQAQAGPARERIIFTGRLTDEQVSLAYGASDCFVLPTRSLECFGIIILEALAHGCPVIGSRVGAIPETLEPILPEGLFEPGDATALSEALTRVVNGTARLPPKDQLVNYVRERYSRRGLLPHYRRLMYTGQNISACDKDI